MDEKDYSCADDLIKDLKKHLAIHPMAVVGPTYHAVNKRIADLYFLKQEELKGIYHLTEAHAATLRLQTVIRYDYKDDQIKNPSKTQQNKGVRFAHGLQKQYVEFDSELAKQEERGLLSRLREMPKEWTVVQLTMQARPENRFKILPKDKDITQPTCLHIVRLPCGETLNEEDPVSVMVDKPKGSEGMPTIFNLIHKATKEHLRTKHGRASEIRKAREKASQMIKEVVDELSSGYLREWRCLLLGSLCRHQQWLQVKDCIDKVFTKHKSYKLDSRSRQLLYRVTDGAVYLTSAEIQSAVACLVTDSSLATDLINAIVKFQQDNSILLAARRQPVIFIVDENLDLFPWEMLPIIKRHPVSRISSIHFLHALYHEHKDNIVDGCRLVSELEMGFYIVNPDEDLKEMETRLVKFLEKRVPKWSGISGCAPTHEQFSTALLEKSIFLYCGHFNGTHYLKQEDISSMRVVALPLLFGCSSAALQELGGRVQPTGVTDKYLMAACPCVIGMQWTVTSDDTDCITVMLLNSWLPGPILDLSSFRSAGDMLSSRKEPELLRLLRDARETANNYSNSAALIARGIPVKMRE
ncbi:separin [Homalodisca vitripennis]|uniref:separin n=1 Tax=Homalodisca vitripennis TaxID=197043 RepID=UPI001EEAB2E9|nr:separin [Homalodisca vitripennis]XP_046672803.1 separin [Homalodisca vitripennis]XP_046672804.1 separin [Homalodisca vitripennis]